MTYNLTGIVTNTTDYITLTQGVNDVLMFGWLGTLLLIGLASIIYMATMFASNDSRKGFAAGSWLVFVFAFFFRIMSLISTKVMIIALLLAAFSAALMFKKD